MKKLLLGDFAVARGAYEGGVRVATAYPGTPSTEITEELARYDDVYSEWSPNEKVAFEVAYGAALKGARTIVSMKHVGLNVAADPLFTAVYAGVNAGLVVAVADDPSVFSSQNEQDTRLTAVSAKCPVLEPSDSQEAADFTALAFELSENTIRPSFCGLRRASHIRRAWWNSKSAENCRLSITKKYSKIRNDARKRAQKTLCGGRAAGKTFRRFGKFFRQQNRNELERAGDHLFGRRLSIRKRSLARSERFETRHGLSAPVQMIGDFAKNVKRCIVAEELAPHLETLIKAHGIAVEGKTSFLYAANFPQNSSENALREARPPCKRRIFPQDRRCFARVALTEVFFTFCPS